MFSIFKKLFGQSESKMAVPAVSVRRPQPSQPSQLSQPGAQVPSVQVAHLSLAAIVARFPAELKALVLAEPDPAATIALPIQLIVKQLASGSVKMSLASLHRQAPAGVLAPLAPGDKRQVEIPLKEIFRHVNPQALKRRDGQRSLDDSENEFNLFGNAENPFEVAPTTPDTAARRDSSTLHIAPSSRVRPAEPVAPLVPASQPSRLAPPGSIFFTPPPAASNGHGANGKGTNGNGSNGSNGSNGHGPAHPTALPVTVPLAPLACAWPAEICGELLALDPATTVTLDGGAVAAGLAKGKVAFTWGEICAGLQPPSPVPTAIAAATELVLPLKIVAPAYLAAAKNGHTARKSVAGADLDASIPELFSGSSEPAPLAAIPLAPLAQPAPAELPEVPAMPDLLEPSPAVLLAAPSVENAPKLPAKVGDLFGEPDKLEFTPAEIVAGTVKLPGVAGAIIALQEGLQVAAALPDGMKSEVVAAFLPQIFARLNQYAGEMSFGEVDDLLFTTHGAHCQIYRLGFVYFAVLGQPGTNLPWGDLQLIAAEVGRQTH